MSILAHAPMTHRNIFRKFWVPSWGTHATVIKPEVLATRVAKIASELANRYPTYEMGN
jgi:hypothetical protein